MVTAPYISIHNMMRQFRAALLIRKQTGWNRFPEWLKRNAWHSIPVAAGAVGMGCIGFGRHAVWEVTEACNLRCRHCHAASGTVSPDELDTKEGFRLIEQIAGLRGFQMLAFSGGEPMVRADIDDLLAYCRKQGLVSVIATNGTLIDYPRAKALVRLGLKGVAVSFDSTDPAIHNHIRQNPNAFQKALQGIEACRRAGMVIQLNYTAMKENVKTLPDVIRFAHDISADIMLCYQLVPMGRGGGITTSALSPIENRELANTIRELQRDAVTIVEPVASPQYWSHIMGRDNLDEAPALKSRLFHGCAAGWGLIYAKPDGEIWPCPFVPISGGNIRTQELKDIHTKSEIFRKLNLSERGGLKGKCGECKNRYICGGCRGKAFAETGDAFEADPTCWIHNEKMPDYRHCI